MFKVDVHGLKGFTAQQENIFINEVIPLLEKVANSAEFKKRVTNYTWTNSKRVGPWYRRRTDSWTETFFKRSDNNSRGFHKTDNFVLYTHFMSGADKFNPEPDSDLDLFLTSYYSRRSVVGYTMPGTFKTWVNRKYFVHWLKSKEGHARIVGNIVHEYMHNLGYSHARRNNSTRRHTVPYAYGEIASTVASLINKGGI